jgi:predicted porin
LQGDNVVAQNTAQFQQYYATIPEQYNKEKLAELGNQHTGSGVVGLSYYFYKDNFFILAYGNYFFYNHKLTEHGSETSDYDYGVIANYKLTKSISLYTQLEYLRYFDRENHTVNIGINLIII